MNIKQAKQEIKHTVKAYLAKNQDGDYQIPAIRQRPMLLIGPPGIGKTQIMEQIARECRIGLVSYTITHHTRQSAVGLPMIREEEFQGKTYSITDYTMSEIIASVYRKQKETGLKEGILFIDEINCVSETLAPTMLQFLQCKTFGNQKVPEGWIIVAAGNPPEYNKSVRDFDMVTLDRVRYLSIEADYYAWREYARAARLHGAVLSYLELKPNQFYKVRADVEGLLFATARGWEDLSNLMETYEVLGIPVTEEVVKEFIHHPDIAEDAAAYFELYKKYQDDYQISNILSGNAGKEIFARLFDAEFDERLSVVNLVLRGLDRLLLDCSVERERTDFWYAFLKNFRFAVKREENKKACYEKLLKEEEERLEAEHLAELITKEAWHRKRRLLMEIKKAGENLQPSMEAKEAFMEAKASFDAQRGKLERAEEEGLQALAHAFTFIEDAFGNGQEMVVFVTELSITPYAARFLAEHTVEKYEEYREKLLIGSRKAELLEELRH